MNPITLQAPRVAKRTCYQLPLPTLRLGYSIGPANKALIKPAILLLLIQQIGVSRVRAPQEHLQEAFDGIVIERRVQATNPTQQHLPLSRWRSAPAAEQIANPPIG